MKSALSLIALAGALAATPAVAQDAAPPTAAAAKQFVDTAAVAYRDQLIRQARRRASPPWPRCSPASW